MVSLNKTLLGPAISWVGWHLGGLGPLDSHEGGGRKSHGINTILIPAGNKDDNCTISAKRNQWRRRGRSSTPGKQANGAKDDSKGKTKVERPQGWLKAQLQAQAQQVPTCRRALASHLGAQVQFWPWIWSENKKKVHPEEVEKECQKWWDLFFSFPTRFRWMMPILARTGGKSWLALSGCNKTMHFATRRHCAGLYYILEKNI